MKIKLTCILASLAVSSPAFAEPVQEGSSPLSSCAQQSREAALRSYNVATSPLTYYLPVPASIVGAAFTSPGPLVPNPEFGEFVRAYAHDLEFTQRYVRILHFSNSAASKVTAHATSKMFLSDAQPLEGGRPGSFESFEEYRGRVARIFGVHMPETELRAAHEDLVRAQRAMSAYRGEYREFTRTSAFKKYGLKIEMLNHTQGWREFIQTSGADRYRTAQEWSERLQERASKSLGAPSSELPASTGKKVIGGLGAGALVAVAAGTPARVPLIQHNCAGDLTLGQANALLEVVTASASGACTVTAHGALELMKMPTPKLEELCKAVPQLPWVLDSAYLAQLERKKTLPKPESLDVDCETSTVHASVRGRNYSYLITPADRDHVDVKITASGVGGRGFAFSSRFNSRTRSFLVTPVSDFSVNTLDAASDEILTGDYLDRRGETSSDQVRKNRVAAGESLNFGRSLIPAMKAFCEGKTPKVEYAEVPVSSDKPY